MVSTITDTLWRFAAFSSVIMFAVGCPSAANHGAAVTRHRLSRFADCKSVRTGGVRHMMYAVAMQLSR